ncbi:MAG: 50S ribosomal protein L9 [Anaerolineae bacterium]|nr:50S ribosomal protein L9 [Anaerolineae bacterium]
MKILLLKDVYKLGRAGDVKKVANGYGRNFLLPKGLAVLATETALSKVATIREEASKERAILNKEMEGVAAQLTGLKLYFPAKAGDTGKLYGSITTHMIADAINAKVGSDVVNHHIIDSQPIRSLGEHTVIVRLTMDLTPEIEILVHREGETPQQAILQAAEPEVAQSEQELDSAEQAAVEIAPEE